MFGIHGVCLNYLIRIMIAALSFLLDYEKIEDDDDDDSDVSSSEDDLTPQKPQDLLSKEAASKVNGSFCVGVMTCVWVGGILGKAIT